MPELPEVEAFRTYIAKTSLRKKITDIIVKDKRLIKGGGLAAFKKVLVGKAFTAAQRSGKYVILSVSSTDKKVVMHFGLTGFIDYRKDANNPPSYAQVTFVFEKGSALFWIEKRKFGKVWLVDDVDNIAGLKDMGPEALAVTQKQFVEIARKSSRKNVKVFLMDQELIAGIGNEYSDEILFQSGIDPRHRIEDLSDAQLKKLYTHMRTVLTYAIKVRIKQMNKLGQEDVYANVDTIGFASKYLQAHRHTDHTCPKHANHSLKVTKIGGRTAYYCPKDQK